MVIKHTRTHTARKHRLRSCQRITRRLAVNRWLIMWFSLHIPSFYIDARGMRVWRATSATLGSSARQRRTVSPVSCIPRPETPCTSLNTGCGRYRDRTLASQHRHTTGTVGSAMNGVPLITLFTTRSICSLIIKYRDHVIQCTHTH